jgi:hypothetical protein
MPSGKFIYFKEGVYATDEPDEIEFLQKEIKSKHPHIFQDPNHATITETKLKDPLAEIKAKAIAEYIEQQKAKDHGSYTNAANPAGVVNSERIAALAKK